MIQALAGYINIILSFFYNLANNYGLAIIMLTVLVNIITFPLTRKQLQASQKMQEIQPELKRIQEKYKHDKEKLNQVTMEFMKENKVNPLGGCLPLLVQFPIIIAVFQLLREPEMIKQTVENFSPYFLSWDLTKADPFYVLPIFAAAATFFHQRLVLTDPKQKIMLYIFPVMILIISINFPAGLLIYWFTNSLFSIGNHYVMKRLDKSKNISESGNYLAEKEETDTKKGDQKVLEGKVKTDAEKNLKKTGRKKKERVLDKNPKKKTVKRKKKGAGKNK